MIPTMVYVVIRACYRIHNVVNSVGLPFILQQVTKTSIPFLLILGFRHSNMKDTFWVCFLMSLA